MQGIFNLMALVSFATSTAILGSAAYVYANRAGIADKVRDRVETAIADEVSAMMPGIIESAAKQVPVPELPGTTGGPLPF